MKFPLLGLNLWESIIHNKQSSKVFALIVIWAETSMNAVMTNPSIKLNTNKRCI
jgi:hypothetical protein